MRKGFATETVTCNVFGSGVPFSRPRFCWIGGAEGIGTAPNEANYHPKEETNGIDTGIDRVRCNCYVPHR
jgi:hypothetical protein